MNELAQELAICLGLKNRTPTGVSQSTSVHLAFLRLQLCHGQIGGSPVSDLDGVLY